MNRKENLLFVKVVILSFALLIFTCVIYVGIVNMSKRDHENSTNLDEKTYKYLKLDKSKNNTSVGFAVLPNFELENDEGFISYKDEGNNHVLISEFGTRAYACTGSCYCDSKNSRRNYPGILLGRGLTYLIAAFTSTAAYQIGKKYFEEKCYAQYEYEVDGRVPDCLRDEIKAIIDSCDGVYEDDLEESDVPVYNEMVWLCKGHCFPNKDLENNSEIRKVMKDFDCEKFQKEGVVKTYDEIVKVFSYRILEPFCKEVSQHQYSLFNDKKGVEFQKNTQLCIGAFPHENFDWENPSVNCLLIHPKDSRDDEYLQDLYLEGTIGF